jgi:hypothetical protein
MPRFVISEMPLEKLRRLGQLLEHVLEIGGHRVGPDSMLANEVLDVLQFPDEGFAVLRCFLEAVLDGDECILLFLRC